RENRQGEDAGQLPHGAAHGFLERPAVLAVVLLHQVGDDFGVGLGDEAVPFSSELFFQRQVVLDDAVVDDDDVAFAVAVGGGVFFGGAAVGGPAGVADAVDAVERLETDGFFQVAELPLAAADV